MKLEDAENSQEVDKMENTIPELTETPQSNTVNIIKKSRCYGEVNYIKHRKC
jgi:hypothetical protein